MQSRREKYGVYGLQATNSLLEKKNNEKRKKMKSDTPKKLIIRPAIKVSDFGVGTIDISKSSLTAN